MQVIQVVPQAGGGSFTRSGWILRLALTGLIKFIYNDINLLFRSILLVPDALFYQFPPDPEYSYAFLHQCKITPPIVV